MIMKALLGAAALATTTAFSATAAPIDLDFSFGGVTGTFYGLDDAQTGRQEATSFDLFGRLDSYIGVGTAGSMFNSFEFTSSGLSIVLFHKEFVVGPSHPVIPFAVGIDSAWVFERGLSSGGGSSELSIGAITFTPQPVSAVPLPAGTVLLLSGLAGVVGLKRRKKNAA